MGKPDQARVNAICDQRYLGGAGIDGAFRLEGAGMIETYPSPDDLADAAAAAIEAALQGAVDARGHASLVATGGRSPGPVYDRLARAEIDWAHVAVTLSDERHVDRDSPNANARQLRERLFQGPAAKAQYQKLLDAYQASASSLGVGGAVTAHVGVHF